MQVWRLEKGIRGYNLEAEPSGMSKRCQPQADREVKVKVSVVRPKFC